MIRWLYGEDLGDESEPTVQDLPAPLPLRPARPLPAFTRLSIGVVAMMASLWASVIAMVTVGVALITLLSSV